MWKMVKNEWVFLGRNIAVRGISLGFVLILGLSVVLGNLQTQSQSERQDEAAKHLREQWEGIEAMNPHGAAHYGTFVFKPSNLLSSLDEGVNSVTGNVIRVEGHVQNEMVYSEASQMISVSKFGKLKSSLLLQYILPLILVFLGFHSVSSEKQSGRLKLLIIQGAQAKNIVWAKTLSIWAYGLGLLALTVLIYALFNLNSLNADIIGRTLLFFLSYSLYYFVVASLSVFFSARWKNATVALTSMLGIWILWTIFLPNILMSAVESWHELPSRNEFKTAMREDRSKGIDGHNPSDERGKELEIKVLEEYEVDSLSQLPINFDGIRMQADEEYGNQVWDKHFGKLSAVLGEQKRSYQLAGLINPFISLQNASKGFTASDNFHHQEFLLQVETYRRGFIKMLNDEHAFGGAKTGDWGWKADNAFYRSVPDYEYRRTPISEAFQTYIPDLALLFFWTLLSSGLLFLGTKKMQIL